MSSDRGCCMFDAPGPATAELQAVPARVPAPVVQQPPVPAPVVQQPPVPAPVVQMTENYTTVETIWDPEDDSIYAALDRAKLSEWKICRGCCCETCYNAPCGYGFGFSPFKQYCCCITDGYCCTPQNHSRVVPTACAISIYGLPGLYLYPKCCVCLPRPAELFGMSEEEAKNIFGAKANARMYNSCCCGCCASNLLCDCQSPKCCHNPGEVNCWCCGSDCACPCNAKVAPSTLACCALACVPSCGCCASYESLAGKGKA